MSCVSIGCQMFVYAVSCLSMPVSCLSMLSVVCLCCQLFVYAVSCLSMLSVVCLCCQLFDYAVSLCLCCQLLVNAVNCLSMLSVVCLCYQLFYGIRSTWSMFSKQSFTNELALIDIRIYGVSIKSKMKVVNFDLRVKPDHESLPGCMHFTIHTLSRYLTNLTWKD